MRLIQNVLRLVGGTALGTAAGFGGLVFLLTLLEKPGEWRGYGALLGGLFCGAPLGALVGLMAAFWWIGRRQGRDRLWGPTNWAGILLGLAAGYAAALRWGLRPGHAADRWALAVVAVAAANLGGILAGVAVALWKNFTAGGRRGHRNVCPRPKG